MSEDTNLPQTPTTEREAYIAIGCDHGEYIEKFKNSQQAEAIAAQEKHDDETGHHTVAVIISETT